MTRADDPPTSRLVTVRRLVRGATPIAVLAQEMPASANVLTGTLPLGNLAVAANERRVEDGDLARRAA